MSTENSEWDELFDHLEQNPVEKEETEDPIEDCDSECFEGTEVATPSPIRPRPRGYRGETIEDYWGERAEQFERSIRRRIWCVRKRFKFVFQISPLSYMR